MAWLSGWQYRRKITVDGNKIDANLTNFPVAVILNSSRFSFSKARSDGYDVRFADESGNLLKYERERHDAINQVAEYHVKIPSLTAGQNYEFYCYYGRLDAADGADPTNVWDSNFKGVWHLKDYTTSSVKDSTSNANDGTKKASNEPIEVDAKIGKGQSFDGSDDYIGVNNSSSLNITTLTLELFLNIDSSKTDFMMPITKYSNSYWVLQINSGTGTTRVLRWIANGLNHFDYTISTDIWKHIVITHSGTNALLYVDGVNVSSSNQTSIPNNPVDLFIGKRNDGYYFKGVIDEVRISNVTRSAAWIKASYHSGNDTLLSFGSEETFTPLSSRRLLLANW